MRRVVCAVAFLLGGPLVAQEPKPTAATVAALEEEVATLEADREVKKARVRAAEVAVEATRKRYELEAKVFGQGNKEVMAYKFEFDRATARLDVRAAELNKAEVKLKYAKKRLDEAKARDKKAEKVDAAKLIGK